MIEDVPVLLLELDEPEAEELPEGDEEEEEELPG